jgi:hypothetical protein
MASLDGLLNVGSVAGEFTADGHYNQGRLKRIARGS